LTSFSSFAQRVAILSKARLASLVAVTTAVGFVVASHPDPLDVSRFFAAVGGTLLAALGANAFNQLMERERDALMIRTSTRPLPAGTLTVRQAFVISTLLALGGDLLLLLAVNPLTAALGLFTQVLYLGLYTPLKPRSPVNTLVGAVVGAVPPVMGWTAVRGTIDPPAAILFLILFLWQMPHFLSLAWLYREDYARGGYRMLPAVDPSGALTSSLVVLYSAALIPLGIGAVLVGLAGWIFLVGAVILGVASLVLAMDLRRTRGQREARRVFFASLIYLPLLMGLLVIDRGPVVNSSSKHWISPAVAAAPATDR